MEELIEVLVRLAGVLTPEVLAENPAIAVAVVRAVALLEDDGAADVPPDVLAAAAQEPEPSGRLRLAVRLLGASDPKSITAVARALANAGLLGPGRMM